MASVSPDPSADGTGLVVDLSRLASASLATVGGKALNLGRLAAADFHRVSASPQPPTGWPRPRSWTPSPPVLTVPDWTASVRAAPAWTGPVAVRSSATAEDLPFASFAGQQDSFMDVDGADAVVDAVRRCWASLWTDRAVAYRTTNGISHRQVALAVVVQQMIDACTAGVLFTANPVTGTRTETVIDASPGRGQAVVSGAVNPDHFAVETASGRILQQPQGRAPSLNGQQLRELTSLGDAAQRLFGAPPDVEWVPPRIPAGRRFS